MIDDTTEAGMVCVCGHYALAHVRPSADDERCSEPGCDCVEFTFICDSLKPFDASFFDAVKIAVTASGDEYDVWPNDHALTSALYDRVAALETLITGLVAKIKP